MGTINTDETNDILSQHVFSMNMSKSKVYVKIDDNNRITRCEGGVTTPEDLTGWVQIDEGVGDKYNLCQSHYFRGSLFTRDGLLRFKYENGKAVLRSDEEINADRDARPKPPPSQQEDLDALLIDYEYRLTVLELGL